MMNRTIVSLVGVFVVLAAGAGARAELKLVANFDGMSGVPDGQACNGVLGGTIDTESENTGNAALGTIDGSTAMNVIGHSSGTLARAIGVGGINNPIDKGESGIGFFRFMMPTGGTIRAHAGLIADTGTNPVNSTRTADPKTIPAGFKLVDNGTGFDLTTVDGATVLKTGLARSSWYNVWIVADRTAETFDLYVSKATGPAGAATLPTPADLLKGGIPFSGTDVGSLNGMIFANPISPTGSGQATRIWVDEIWWDGSQGLAKPTTAKSPSPADKAQDVARDVILSWKPAAAGVQHDVYFGTSQDDVSSADRTNPRGVLASQAQDANTFDPAGLLELGKSYYWRIDEVNTAASPVVSKGLIWSFTVEPVSYPIAKVTATASSATEGMGPEKTVDGSGLNAGDQHGTDPMQMWLTASGAAQPAWIQYQFDAAYKIDRMLVWNSNQVLEAVLGFGAKSVTVEYSGDGTAWTKLGDFEFARATGAATYTANTTVDFGGALAKFVRLTIKSSWGSALAQYGLSEVRFYYIPVLPRGPVPAVGQTGVAVDTVLKWRAGREAASHQVYFGTDRQAVADGKVPVQTVGTNSFDPGALNLGTTYYWKVAEVNNAKTPSAWPGEVWSFTTREYVVVDDFESYDDDGNRIYDAWIDGLSDNSNGSTVGYLQEPFAERTIVHGGKQSMPLEYNNVKTPFYSEAGADFVPVQNWSLNGADTFTLWVRGRPVSFVESSPNHILMNGMGTDIYGTADQGRFVYEQLAGDGSIIARVDNLTNTNGWAKAGVMIRQTLEAGSAWAYVLASPQNGVHFQARLATGAGATSDTTLALPAAQTTAQIPVWVKLERKGSEFSAYYATGATVTTWTPIPWNPQTIAMGASVYIGLAVTSHAAGVVAQAEFSSIATTGNVTGSWQSVSLGVAQPAGNLPDTLYVTVQDSSGHKATATHPDPSITTTGAWTPWSIPLSTFTSAGVKTSSVKKLTIGVGDKAKPVPGGAGLLYLDDLAVGHPASQ